MTDIASFKPNADWQLTQKAPLAPTILQPLTNGHYDQPIEEDDSSTIKCLCGYSEDDGSTVLCEKCDTWQHIACYYANHADVPDVHECTDCDRARKVDPSLAHGQRQRRQQIHEINGVTGDKKGRKTATKSHKKKTKDSISAPAVNGYPIDKPEGALHDRNSGSPREFPPAKRHKASHKTTPSMHASSQVPQLASSRKRAASTLQNGTSPIKSPTTPQDNGFTPEVYSAEFLQLYRDREDKHFPTNIVDLGLTTDLGEWLEDPDQLAEVTNGCKPTEIFQRLPGGIEELEETAPAVRVDTIEDQSNVAQGLHPIWKRLVADSPVSVGSFIGELRGHIDRVSDYRSNPTNRWQSLGHPEPLVYSPPHLPIVIDARQEGSPMRYIRRSCQPNVNMRIFISEGRWYHFCLLAAQDIEPGTELTLAWEIPPNILDALRTSMQKGDIARDGIQVVEEMSRWVSTVLSNFGGCACNRAPSECLLERARGSSSLHAIETAPRTSKGTKARKGRKQQISPISTGHATNSRANSEAIQRGEQDDDNLDTRSASGSSRSKQGSRDNTPMTAHSLNDEAAIGLGISDRERRKLMQLNRLFEQQEQKEHTEQTGQKRKKRNSAGSTLNTPTATVSKQLGHSEPSPSTNKTRTTATPRTNGGGPSKGKREVIQRQKPKPIYVDMETQTEPEPAATPAKPIARKTYVSPLRALLQRSRNDRLRREQRLAESSKDTSKSPSPTSAPGSPATKAPSSPSVDLKSSTTSVATDATIVKEAIEDVEMKDVDVAASALQATISNETVASAPDAMAAESIAPATASPTTKDAETGFASPAIRPASAKSTEPSPDPPSKPTNLHVDLPPVPNFAAAPSATTPSITTPASLGPSSAPIVQSPAPLTIKPTSLGPPTPNAIVAPSPVRKTLSLSEYRKRKTEAQAATATPFSNGSVSPSHEPNQQSGIAHSDAMSDAASNADSKDVEMKDTDSVHSLNTDPTSPRPANSHPPPPLFSSTTS